MDVSTHYDSVHNHTQQERREGMAFPLKKYHNQIKRTLLEKYARDADSLLDIGCGRGGDIQKWLGCNIKTVVGVDVSPREIEEAFRRWESIRGSRLDAKDKTYNFHVGNFNTFKVSGGPYQVITAMFCLNYFFSTEQQVLDLAAKVAQNLKPGGVFLGTIVDGRRFVQALHGRASFDDGFCELIQWWKDDPQNFGSEFTFQINDTVVAPTVVAPTDVAAPPREYLSFKSTFKAIFERAGIQCIEMEPFTPPPNQYWTGASGLYNYFAFKFFPKT